MTHEESCLVECFYGSYIGLKGVKREQGRQSLEKISLPRLKEECEVKQQSDCGELDQQRGGRGRTPHDGGASHSFGDTWEMGEVVPK